MRCVVCTSITFYIRFSFDLMIRDLMIRASQIDVIRYYGLSYCMYVKLNLTADKMTRLMHIFGRCVALPALLVFEK